MFYFISRVGRFISLCLDQNFFNHKQMVHTAEIRFSHFQQSLNETQEQEGQMSRPTQRQPALISGLRGKDGQKRRVETTLNHTETPAWAEGGHVDSELS